MAEALLSRKYQLSRECFLEAMKLILCAFENLQNATVSFVLSVRPSAWTQVALRWTNVC